MKIGIVATYSSKTPAGLERYLLTLIESLSKYDTKNIYTIYTKKGSKLEKRLSEKGVSNVKVKEIAGLFWKDLGLLRYAKEDAYIFDGLRIPLFFIPKTFAIIVYDYAFKRFADGSVKQKIKHAYVDMVIRFGFRNATKIITISNQTKEDTIKYFKVPENKIDVIYPGCNTFSKIAKTSCIAKPPYLFSIGRIKPRKNFLGAVKGFAKYKTENPNDPIKFYIAGHFNKDSSYKKLIDDYIDRHTMQNDVIFLGHVEDSAIASLYSNSEALLFPSLLEGFGFPVLEAIAAGSVVITSKGGALEEVAGDAAILVNPKNIESIAEGIKQLRQQEGKKEELLKKGVSRLEAFTWKKTAQNFSNIFANIR